MRAVQAWEVGCRGKPEAVRVSSANKDCFQKGLTVSPSVVRRRGHEVAFKMGLRPRRNRWSPTGRNGTSYYSRTRKNFVFSVLPLISLRQNKEKLITISYTIKLGNQGGMYRIEKGIGGRAEFITLRTDVMRRSLWMKDLEEFRKRYKNTFRFFRLLQLAPIFSRF